MSEKKGDHVILDANFGGAFRCLHCGDKYKPAMPIAFDDWIALAESFLRRHKRCPAKQTNNTTNGE